jgi:hypothetical protein
MAIDAINYASFLRSSIAARKSISGVEASKANCINRVYGAGDGNRTHVRSLGSFYTAIVRRPLFVSDCTQELIFRTAVC